MEEGSADAKVLVYHSKKDGKFYATSHKVLLTSSRFQRYLAATVFPCSPRPAPWSSLAVSARISVPRSSTVPSTTTRSPAPGTARTSA